MGWKQDVPSDLCCEDLPDGFDPSDKKQLGKKWVNSYLDRKGLSMRTPANKKKASVFERLHKIHGFHWYCVYQNINGFCRKAGEVTLFSKKHVRFFLEVQLPLFWYRWKA